MEKSEKEFIEKNTNFLITLTNIGSYGFYFAILILLLMLAIFLKKKISNYLYKRRKLIDHSEEYERKRNSRNDLKVI